MLSIGDYVLVKDYIPLVLIDIIYTHSIKTTFPETKSKEEADNALPGGKGEAK